MNYPRKEDQIKNRVVRMYSEMRSIEVQSSFEVRFEKIAADALAAAQATVGAMEAIDARND